MKVEYILTECTKYYRNPSLATVLKDGNNFSVNKLTEFLRETDFRKSMKLLMMPLIIYSFISVINPIFPLESELIYTIEANLAQLS